MHRQSTIQKVATFGVSVLLGMWILTGVASAAPAQRAGAAGDTTRGNAGQTSATKDCDGTHHSATGHGANTDGASNPYHNTCSPEHEAGNGVGDGNATGKPCAGCVGNADDKNPPGQAPGGSDHNAGYECDRNQGIGQENPAHTGCQESPGSDGGSTPPVCPVDMAAMTDHEFVINGTTHVDDITGVVKPGDDVEVSFTIAAGCSDVEVSLASYGGDRKLSDSDTGHFAAGDHTLAVTTPDCATEVDFVMGAVVATLGNATGSPYSDQHRLIDAGRSSSSCPGGNVGGSNTDSGSSQGSSQGSSSNTSGSTPAVTVLGSAVNAAAGDAVPATVYELLGMLATPKSAIFTVPLSKTTMLAGLMSR